MYSITELTDFTLTMYELEKLQIRKCSVRGLKTKKSIVCHPHNEKKKKKKSRLHRRDVVHANYNILGFF
jgi:hypothetical protein